MVHWLITSATALLGLILILLNLSACSSQSGWRVSFGVSPVAAISETQTTTDKRKVE